MSRTSLFSSPFFVGFDEVERLFERVAKASSDGYPPYNIEQFSATRYRISVAVAGFAEDDLSVTVEDNQLCIRGQQSEEGERYFLHRGIAARQFQRNFILANGLEVVDAALDNGLLHIEIERPVPHSEARRIEIRGADGGSAPGAKRA